MFRLNVKKCMRNAVEKMIGEDEEIATERHRRGVAIQREHGVIHAVPVADEWIYEIQNED